MRLSLTELVDVVSKAGARKAGQVSLIKARSLEDYSPAKDFYKQLRDAVIGMHKADRSKDWLDATLFSVSEKNRRNRYAKIIPAYKKWLGKKHVSWFCPGSGVYKHAGVSVVVNPELGLQINGVSFVIKLYFKTEALEKQSAGLITALMGVALQDGSEVQFAVLDVERGKLHLQSDKAPELVMAMVNAELAYVENLWLSLDQAA